MNARKVVELLIGWTKVRELMESSGRVLLLKSCITLFYIFGCFLAGHCRHLINCAVTVSCFFEQERVDSFELQTLTVIL